MCCLVRAARLRLDWDWVDRDLVQRIYRGESTLGIYADRDMGIQIQREHRKAEAAGTRAPVKANGLPVKAPKPTSLVNNSRPTS